MIFLIKNLINKLHGISKNRYFKILRFTSFLMIFLILQLFSYQHFSKELFFKDRGDRYEGIKAYQLSGIDLEIISFSTLNYKSEEKISCEDYYKLEFFLNEKIDFKIKIRNIKKANYIYLMIPKTEKWRSGYNEFMWPTETVIKPMNIKLRDLGGLAEASNNNLIPISLYENKIGEIYGYRFILKTITDVYLECNWYKISKGKYELINQYSVRQVGGKIFALDWIIKDRDIQEGFYQLNIKGFLRFDDHEEKIQREFRFYQKRSIKD